MDAPKLPAYGTKLRCITNRDRPELTEGQIYVVVHEPDLSKIPELINPNRFYPDDYRWIAIRIPGQKDNGVYPIGIFEIIK